MTDLVSLPSTDNYKSQQSPWDYSKMQRQDSVMIDAYKGEPNSDRMNIGLYGMQWSEDGKTLYVVDGWNPYVWNFPVQEPFNLHTVRRDLAIFENINAITGATWHWGIQISPDGTKLYTMNPTNDSMYELEMTVPWDITTLIASDSFSVAVQNTAPGNPYFKPDGTAFFVPGNNVTDGVYQYSMSTPWDLTTAAYDSKVKDVGTETTSCVEVQFKPDGLKMYVGTWDEIFQYTLSVAWDVSTATYDRRSCKAPRESSMESFIFSNDGFTLWYHEDSYITTNWITLETAWDVSSWINTIPDTAGYETDVKACAMSQDGTMLAIAGDQSNTVSQFPLSTPFDLSTAIKAFYPNEDAQQQSFVISPDGTKMFTLEIVTEIVREYRLNVPHKITSAVPTGETLSVSAQATTMAKMVAKPDGTKFYVQSYTGHIYQYDLTGAWDLSTASYASKVYDTTAPFTPTGLTIDPDGETYFVFDTDGPPYRIFQYTMGTAWDISTSSYDSKSFTVPAAFYGIYSIEATPDGSRILCLTRWDESVVEIILGTAWDLATAKWSGIAVRLPIYPLDMKFNSDGTKMYFFADANPNPNILYEFHLGTAYRIATMNPAVPCERGIGVEGSVRDISFKPDGSSLYIIGQASDSIHQMQCAFPFDWQQSVPTIFSEEISVCDTMAFGDSGKMLYVATSDAGVEGIWAFYLRVPYDPLSGACTGQFFECSAQSTLPSGLFFNSAGTKMFVQEYTNSIIYQYTLSTAWDVTTASYDSVSFDPTQVTNAWGLTFRPDGTKFYVCDTVSGLIYQYSCSAFDISDASYDSKSYTISETSNPFSVVFNSAGTKMLIHTGNGASDAIYGYTLSTPWDVSTASYDSESFTLTVESSQTLSILINPTGTLISVLDDGSDTVWSLPLETAWDLTTARVYESSFLLSGQDPAPRGVYWKPDGLKFYIVGSAHKVIYQYSCTRAWDVTSASYESKSFDLSPGVFAGDLYFVWMNDDGTKLYVGVDGQGMVWQYDLSVAYDVSTASWEGVIFDFANPWWFTGGISVLPGGETIFFANSGLSGVIKASNHFPIKNV